MRSGLPRLLLLLALLGGLAGWAVLKRSGGAGPSPRGVTPDADRQLDEAARAYLALEAREQAADAQFWGPELDAEVYEDEVNRIWDALNASSNSWPVLRSISVPRVELPSLTEVASLPHGIRRFRSSGLAAKGSGTVLNAAAWIEWLNQWEKDGWGMGRTRWQLVRHVPGGGAGAARSWVTVTLPVEKVSPPQRGLLTATAVVEWSRLVAGTSPAPETIRVESIQYLTRTGALPFVPWLEAEIPTGLREFMDPLVVADLDGDGFAEPAMVGANRVWWNRAGPNGRREFLSEPLASLPVDPIVAAVRADLNGDGFADLGIASPRGLEWVAGNASGRPTGSPHGGWVSPAPLRHPQAIAAGDVDGDGDVDLWVCQYKVPYQGGQFPTPYQDANDGFPGTLLLNDGHGHFIDGTEAAGLGGLRNRRAYSASFVDLNGDGFPDLVQVSDFAGVDVWLNDGKGHFKRVSDEWGAARAGFGMAHAIADLNGDGHPELLMLGMDSAVADRLEAGGWNRSDYPQAARFRSAMTFGNRLLFGSSRGLVPAPDSWARALARTGWSWGAAFADFDNDRLLDLVVGAGHETRASTRDYERQFWRHDLYVGGSTNDAASELFFRTAAGRRRADGASYGGWQQSQLRLQAMPRGTEVDFPEVAWLLGVGVADDCRNVVVEDLDGDGRLDLILTTSAGWPKRKQRLLIFHNELITENHWIGFRLDGHGRSPLGARVELLDSTGRQTRWVVAGDSYRSQSTGRAHFGLGSARPVEATIHWPDGRTTRLDRPSADTWHSVEPIP